DAAARPRADREPDRAEWPSARARLRIDDRRPARLEPARRAGLSAPAKRGENMSGHEKCRGRRPGAGALLALLLGISLLDGRSAAAQAPALRLAPPAVLTAGEINCAADFGAPPNQFIDAAGKQQGVNPDIMAQVAKEVGVQLKWTNLPFGSQIAGLQGKRF